MTYANARYYEQDIGKFTAIDPASRDNPSQFLLDPQQFNSYSYARNNPLILVDTTGEYSREANTGYTGFKGIIHRLSEPLGSLRAYAKIKQNEKQIDSLPNSNLIKSIIFEEQTHGLDDVFTDFIGGSTVGVMQITVNAKDDKKGLGYTPLSRTDLLNAPTNIANGSERVELISQALEDKNITRNSEGFPAYVGSAYNQQSALGKITDYGKRVEAYHQDFEKGRFPAPDDI